MLQHLIPHLSGCVKFKGYLEQNATHKPAPVVSHSAPSFWGLFCVSFCSERGWFLGPVLGAFSVSHSAPKMAKIGPKPGPFFSPSQGCDATLGKMRASTATRPAGRLLTACIWPHFGLSDRGKPGPVWGLSVGWGLGAVRGCDGACFWGWGLGCRVRRFLPARCSSVWFGFARLHRLGWFLARLARLWSVAVGSSVYRGVRMVCARYSRQKKRPPVTHDWEPSVSRTLVLFIVIYYASSSLQFSYSPSLLETSYALPGVPTALPSFPPVQPVGPSVLAYEP